MIKMVVGPSQRVWNASDYVHQPRGSKKICSVRLSQRQCGNKGPKNILPVLRSDLGIHIWWFSTQGTRIWGQNDQKNSGSRPGGPWNAHFWHLFMNFGVFQPKKNSCRPQIGFKVTFKMFFNSRNPNMESKWSKKFKIPAQWAPKCAFLTFFDDFCCFLA